MKKEIQEIFIQETSSDLALIQEELVSNAKGVLPFELVEKVFRTMHTIKGSGPMFGFDHLCDIAIPVEKVYKDLFNGEGQTNRQLVEKTTHVVKLLYDALKNSDDHVPGSPDEKALILYFNDIC